MPSEDRELTYFSWGKSLRRGCAAPWRGFVLLARTPSLWKAALVPILLNAVVTSVLCLSVIALIDWLWGLMLAKPRQNGMHWYWEIPAAAVEWAVAICAVTAAWSAAQFAVCGCWIERLVRKVEQRYGLPADEFPPRAWKACALPAREHAAIAASLALACTVLNCIPFLGAVAGVASALIAGCLIAGRTLFSFPLGLRGRDDPESLTWCERHFWHTEGIGLMTLVTALVPVLGGVVAVSSAIGATLLFRELDETAGLTTPLAPRRGTRNADLVATQG